jgi:hypothetical protein
MSSKGRGGSRVVALAAVLALSLSACGGLEGEGSEGCEHGCSGVGTTPPVVGTASLALSAPGSVVTATLPQGFALTSLSGISVNWTSRPTGAVQCVKLSNGVNGPFMAAQLTPVTAGTFSFVPQVMPAVLGIHKGSVILQAYSDAGCLLAISGASLPVPYTVTVR